MHYAAGLWRFYGINIFDQDRLDVGQFLAMCHAVDQHEREVSRDG